MPIPVSCPACGQKYKVRDTLSGKQFACQKCEQVIRIPNPNKVYSDDPVELEDMSEAPRPAENDEYALPEADLPYSDDVGDLPPVIVKRKKKSKKTLRDDDNDHSEDGQGEPRRAFEFSFGGMPISILASVGCNVILLLWCIVLIFDNHLAGNTGGAFVAASRVLWIAWTTFDIWNGNLRGRIISILLSGFGLFFAYVVWTYLLPLLAKSPEIVAHPEVMLFAQFSIILQICCWTTNLIALFMPSASQHCQEW